MPTKIEIELHIMETLISAQDIQRLSFEVMSSRPDNRYFSIMVNHAERDLANVTTLSRYVQLLYQGMEQVEKELIAEMEVALQDRDFQELAKLASNFDKAMESADNLCNIIIETIGKYIVDYLEKLFNGGL